MSTVTDNISRETRGGVGDPDWHRVSPAFVWVTILGNFIGFALLATAWLLLRRIPELTLLVDVAAALIAALIVLSTFLAARRVRSIGYQLRRDELVFRRGIMLTRQVAVPYGRMQLIDISQGPVLRLFGLASLRFVTAAAATGVLVPGIRLAEAEELRDELARRAESRRSGL